MRKLYTLLTASAFVASMNAFAQPSNDLCENAIEVFLGADQPYDNTEALLDGPDHPTAPCFSFGDDNVSNDIWYIFNADFTGSVEWSTCNQSTVDTRMAVYQNGATCPVEDGDLLACNDDGGGCANFTSYMIFPVEEGGTYLLRLGGYADGDVGPGTFDLLEIAPPPVPDNNNCENATELTIVGEAAANGGEGWVAATTIGASFSADIPTCSINELGEFQDVWFTFNTGDEDFVEIRIEADTQDAEFCIDIYEACEVLAPNVDNGGDLESNCFSAAEIDIANLGIVEAGSFDNNTEYLIRVSSQITYFPAGDFDIVLVSTSGNSVDENANAAFAIYPNPSNGVLKLRNNELSGQKLIQVLDMTGRVAYCSLSFLNAGQTIDMDLQALNAGIYLVQMGTVDGSILGTSRLVIE